MKFSLLLLHFAVLSAGCSAPLPLLLQPVRLLANQGDIDAMLELGDTYYLGIGVPENHLEAIKWYKLAAEKGSSDAMFELGEIFTFDMQDLKEAMRWYHLAADKGDVPSQAILGFAYSEGEGTARDAFKAIKWTRLAAQSGHAHAQANLGSMYAHGEGTVENYVYAYAWSSISAASGIQMAQDTKTTLSLIMSVKQVAEAETLSRELASKIQQNIIRKTSN